MSAEKSKNNPRNPRKICVTGDWLISRGEVQQEIRKRGDSWITVVSRNTDLLLYADKESNTKKMQNAQQLGIPTMPYADYFGTEFTSQIRKNISNYGIENKMEYYRKNPLQDAESEKRTIKVQERKRKLAESSRMINIILENRKKFIPITIKPPEPLSQEDFLGLIEKINEHAFNEKQKEAIFASYDKPCYIVAGPGSGKTTVLVYRILKFLFIDGLAPENIIATTFTRKAARELKGRVLEKGYHLIQEIKKIKQDSTWTEILDKYDLNRIIIGTLDSICQDILVNSTQANKVPLNVVDEIVAIGMFRRFAFNPIIYSNPDQSDELRDNVAEIAKKMKKDNTIRRSDVINFLYQIHDRLIQEQISLDKFKTLLRNEKKEEAKGVDAIINILQTYRKSLEEHGLLDYALLEEKFLQELRDPTIQIFPNDLQAVVVDEYQDTNYLQEQIYFMLAKLTKGSITIVGDDDQSLYRFRGSVVNLFKFFPERIQSQLSLLDKPQPIFLMENYRSTQKIIDFYNEFLQIDDSYYRKMPTARIDQKPTVQFPIDSTPNINAEYPILIMLREDIETLGKDLAIFINAIFNEKGYKTNISQNGSTRNIMVKRERKEEGIFSDVVLLCSSPQEQNSSGNYTLSHFLREELDSFDINVFNPRGFDIQQIPAVQILLGLLLMCLDPDETIQNGIFLWDDVSDTFERWRYIANEFLQCCSIFTHKNKERQEFYHYLPKFIKDWGERKSSITKNKKTKPWPDSTPILELIYKLSSWITDFQSDFSIWKPIFHDDPEYMLYLESIVSLLNNIAEFSPWHGDLVRFIREKDGSKKNVEKFCLENLYREFFVEIANGDLGLNEDLIEIFPQDRFSIMSIHQSKGLEFPLVIVDVCSNYKTNQWTQRFKRFPDKLKEIYALEDYMQNISNNPKDNRSSLDHAFDDLIRLYYVAYSRPQSLLLLVGIYPETQSLREAHKFIPNIAVGFDRENNHSWDLSEQKAPWWYI